MKYSIILITFIISITAITRWGDAQLKKAPDIISFFGNHVNKLEKLEFNLFTPQKISLSLRLCKTKDIEWKNQEPYIVFVCTPTTTSNQKMFDRQNQPSSQTTTLKIIQKDKKFRCKSISHKDYDGEGTTYCVYYTESLICSTEDMCKK